MLFVADEEPPPHANLLRLRLGRDAGVTLSVQAKRPGHGLTAQTVDLDVDFDTALGRMQEPYERLLADAIDGNPARFARKDGVEAEWRVVQPAIDQPGDLHGYESGGWGPAQAETILAGHHWHDPTA